MLDINKIRQDFPILATKVYGKDLIYFDSAASSQKPLQVINAISDYYKNSHANIHRALHYLGDTATTLYESARDNIANFINARSSKEVIFTRGTTEGINLVATCLERANMFSEGDEIILSVMEHHSNIVPWQMYAERHNLIIKVVKILDNGDLDLKHLYSLLSSRTKLLAITHVSNSLGTINPVKDIIKTIREYNSRILVLVDGAQAAPNIKVDVQDLDCDFYVISGHKLYGPTGIGILFGKYDILNDLPPYHGGGEMIDQVILPMGTTYAELPQKFEAGTPHIAGVIGLSAAIDYLNSLDLSRIKLHKDDLLKYCSEQLQTIHGLKIHGKSSNKVSVVSFSIDNINAQDVGLLLDQNGIAVRTGHHCNMPLMDYLGVSATIRASFGIYNTKQEVDLFIESLNKVINLLK